MKKKGTKLFWLALLIFGSTSVSDTAYAQTLVVALGDSLTEGFGVARDEAYPYLLEKELLSRGHKIKIINAGVSGSTSASAPSRLKWYLRTNPKIVIIALGGNDGLRGLSVLHMKKNLGRAIELAQSKNILVLLAGMQIPQNYGREYTNSFRNTFYELAQQYKLPLIPFLLKDVGGVPKLNLPDGIHPNAEGHQILTLTVLKYLEPLLSDSQ
ncbi:MAG: arylesterase [SAR324 cluster bacterium]|nr:arylesterase [SAR324 cluster bacterium]